MNLDESNCVSLSLWQICLTCFDLFCFAWLNSNMVYNLFLQPGEPPTRIGCHAQLLQVESNLRMFLAIQPVSSLSLPAQAINFGFIRCAIRFCPQDRTYKTGQADPTTVGLRLSRRLKHLFRIASSYLWVRVGRIDQNLLEVCFSICSSQVDGAEDVSWETLSQRLPMA